MNKYDNKFKRNAVRLVIDGQAVRSVSHELGANEFQIHKWRRAVLANQIKLKFGLQKSAGI